MTRNRIVLIALGVLVLIGGLGLLRLTSLRRRDGTDGEGGNNRPARQQLGVGFLPVT